MQIIITQTQSSCKFFTIKREECGGAASALFDKDNGIDWADPLCVLRVNSVHKYQNSRAVK